MEDGKIKFPFYKKKSVNCMLNNKNNKLFSVVLQSFQVFIVLKGSHITHPLIPEKKQTIYLVILHLNLIKLCMALLRTRLKITFNPVHLMNAIFI